ncbi:MAG: POTRA domain-containing protein, partial [Vicinamibacteria bacterium]
RALVDIVGNDSIPDSVLLRELPRPGSAAFHDLVTAKRPRLKQILALRYASDGFVAATIADPETSFDAATGDYRVTIPVVEGDRFQVEAIAIHGAESVSEGELRSRLSLRGNEPFRVTGFVQDRSALASYYRDRGYPDVRVDAQVVERTGTAGLDVKFRVNEGPRVAVGEIRVAGNEETRESVIRREVELEKGDPLSASEMNRIERKLYELGIFQSAEVVVDEAGSSGETRDLRVQVSETPDLELDYGARLSTDGFFEVLTELRAPNLFGRAQHVGLRTLLGSERRILRFSYHSPYLSRYRLDTDFFLERARLYEGPEPIEGSDEMTTPFTERTWTFTAQQTRPLVEDDLTLQWSYSFDRTVTEIEDFLGSVFEQNNHIFT